MNKDDAEEMKLEMLRVSAICATQKDCGGCPADLRGRGCSFVCTNIPPRRWLENPNLREGVE
ncbi:MAG: hypothetical protein IJ521_10410 [Schwartzia sp.]|nr:hypothetical protein [Schwartzia sp. (in: firmicutes)]